MSGNNEEECVGLAAFKRNKYFYGKLLTVRDFEDEQSYINKKRYLINRAIHGIGLVCGLEVSNPKPKPEGSGFEIDLAEGVALDCCGHEIVVSQGGTKDVKGLPKKDPDYIYLKYKEEPVEPVPVPANASSCEEICCGNRILESFELVFGDKPTELSGDEFVAEELTKRGIANDYYENKLSGCPVCQEPTDPKVFLAVIEKNEDGFSIDETETKKYRSIVYNNPMLYDLLSGHLTDFENPHKVDSKQVKALMSVNEVGNEEDKEWVKNINLESEDGTIGITPKDSEDKIDLKLNENSVDRQHITVNAVTEDKIDKDAVISEKIADGVVTAEKIGKDAVISEKIADGAVTAEKIGKGSIKDEKIAKDADIAEKKIKFDTGIGHNHDGINSRLIESSAVSNLAHVKSINWKHNGDTPISQIGTPEAIGLKVNFDKDIVSETINEHTFLVMVKMEEEETNTFHYDCLRGDIGVAGKEATKEAKFTIPDADQFIDRELKVVLKSDFIIDKEGKALDGNFIGGKLPSGNGYQGGDFESWFYPTPAAGYTCIRGKLFRSVEGKQPPYPNAPIKVYKSGTENIVAKDSSDKSGNYCIDDIPTSSTVDIIVKEQLIDSKYRCNRAEMTKIDTGTTPGSCSDEKCIEVEDIIAKCSPITARTCISGKVVRTYPFTGEEPLPGASVTVTRSGTKEVNAKGSTDDSGIYCIDKIPLGIQVDIFVERGEHLYYKAEMKDIDTGGTPGNCKAGDCVEIVKLVGQ